MSERLPREHRYRYELTEFVGTWTHRWVIVARHGAVEFWVRQHLGMPNLDDSAGLEMHWRVPPPHMETEAPSHDKCHSLGGPPCWHDGTSLYATEQLLPLVDFSNPRDMFLFLLSEVGRLDEDARTTRSALSKAKGEKADV